MPTWSRWFLGVLLVLLFWSTVATAEFWNPFARHTDRVPQPYHARSEQQEEARWFLLPPLRWSDRTESDGPSLWEQWQTSTHRTLMQTRDLIVAPFEAAAEKSSEFTLWPRWPGLHDEKSTTPPGWFADSPPPPSRPATVNDFLALPRPE